MLRTFGAVLDMSQNPIDPPASAGRAEAVDPKPHDAVRVAATLVSAAIIICALYFGRDVLIPLACAFLISFALHPLVSWLVRIGLPRIGAVIVVMTMILALIGGLVVVLGAQLRSLSEELPTYQSTIRAKIDDMRGQFKVPAVLDDPMSAVEEEPKSEPSARLDAPQRVEVVPRSKEPIEMASEWLAPSLQPLATAGIVFVFVFLALLDRSDLRDRLLRLLGGNLHRSTDALEEAGTRISKYLLMQVIVNVSYAVPMAIGLWLIGVPGAMLWGAVAAIMRFVPYVGPLISAVFPIGLAFAVDPGWSMVLWTVALILLLELISNNIVEPVLYGTSTGLSAMSLIAAATFWTALWDGGRILQIRQPSGAGAPADRQHVSRGDDLSDVGLRLVSAGRVCVSPPCADGRLVPDSLEKDVSRGEEAARRLRVHPDPDLRAGRILAQQRCLRRHAALDEVRRRAARGNPALHRAERL